VLAYAGDVGLGLFALVIMARETLDLLPGALSQVIYPRMAERFGRTGRLDDLIRMSVKPMLIAAAGMAAMAAVGWWLVEPVTRIVLPKYVAAVPAVQWGLLIPVLASFMPAMNVYNVVRRQDLYVVAIILGMAAYFGSLLWLVRGGAPLTAFPQAMLIGRAVFFGAGYLLLWPLVRKDRRR
jgi:O-antigen/teichoic acid export membrane protein